MTPTYLEKTNMKELKPKALGLSSSYQFPIRTTRSDVVGRRVKSVDVQDVIVTGDVEIVHGRKIVI